MLDDLKAKFLAFPRKLQIFIVVAVSLVLLGMCSNVANADEKTGLDMAHLESISECRLDNWEGAPAPYKTCRFDDGAYKISADHLKEILDAHDLHLWQEVPTKIFPNSNRSPVGTKSWIYTTGGDIGTEDGSGWSSFIITVDKRPHGRVELRRMTRLLLSTEL